MTAPRFAHTASDLALPAGSAVQSPGFSDPVVRSSHWGIASVVLLNALVTGGGSVVHVSLVRAARALLLRWLVRRVPAPTEARFSAFMPNPVTALGHVFDLALGKARAYPLHNLTRQRLHLVTCLP